MEHNNFIKELLTDRVKEGGISDIILNYKKDFELSNFVDIMEVLKEKNKRKYTLDTYTNFIYNIQYLENNYKIRTYKKEEEEYYWTLNEYINNKVINNIKEGSNIIEYTGTIYSGNEEGYRNEIELIILIYKSKKDNDIIKVIKNKYIYENHFYHFIEESDRYGYKYIKYREILSGMKTKKNKYKILRSSFYPFYNEDNSYY